LGAAALHFALHAMLPPATSSTQECYHFQAKRILWLSLLGAAAPHFALHVMLPPATSSTQDCYHFQCKTHTLALPVGGCGTSIRLARDAAASHFLNTGMLSFPMQNAYFGSPYGGCGTSCRLAHNAAASHFLNTGMLPFPMQNAYFGSPYWGLRHLISPCALCCRQPLPQHRNATISNAKRILWVSLLGAAAPHFACDAAASHFLNTGMLPFPMQNAYFGFPIGGCGTSFRLARDAAASHFLNTGMLIFPMQNAYFGFPYWGLRHLISPCARCCRQPLPQHRNATISGAKSILWLSLLGAAAPHFPLRAMLPPATSSTQECYHFPCETHTLALPIEGCGSSFRLARDAAASHCLNTEECYHFLCKTDTLALPIGGCGTSFRRARDAAASHFLNTGMLLFPCKMILWLSLLGAAAPHFALRAMLPPATSSTQECYHFLCKTHTLAFPIGGCGTLFRFAPHAAASDFLNTGMLPFPQHRNATIYHAKRILWLSLWGAAASHFALRAMLPTATSSTQECYHFHAK